jgi:hypothetical protein
MEGPVPTPIDIQILAGLLDQVDQLRPTQLCPLRDIIHWVSSIMTRPRIDVTNLGPLTMDSTPPRFGQVIVTILGYTCLSGVPGYEILMRVAGKARLIRLLRGALGDLAGDLRAFLTELEESQWESAQEVLQVYPEAEVAEQRFVVSFDGQNCVVVALNYQSGIALIEYAGLKSGRSRKPLHKEARA